MSGQGLGTRICPSCMAHMPAQGADTHFPRLPAGFVVLQHGFAGFERGGCVSAHCEAPHVGRLEGISLRLADAGASWLT